MLARAAAFPIRLLLCLVAALAGPAVASDGPEPWAAPPLDRAVAVFDGRTGESLSFSEMLDRLAGADAVFLGETHIDETTHRVELAVYEGLLARRRGGVVLAMEMFERDVQPVLDAYLSGEIDEAAFIEGARAWGQYRSAYRPLVERARADGRPVVASNFPRPLIRQVAMQGLGALDGLDEQTRRFAPAEILANTPAYWTRVDNTIRGHAGMMRRAGDDQRLTSTQTLWDNAMGESCALALDAHPGSMVLHINGAFHSAYWDGTVRQFALRKPDASVLTIDVRTSRNPSVAELKGPPVADFVVVAEARAMDRNEEAWGVALDRKLEYRLHLPEAVDGADAMPLLIWLGDDGLGAADGMDLWRDRLGDEAIIAVLEPPYRARSADQSEGGRWFWADSFGSDIGALVAATERAWGYLMRSYPVDPSRVCVAGEGTGATVAVAIALLGDRMSHEAIAFEPGQYAKLKDFPLPLPEYSGNPDRAASVTVIGTADDESWWRDELEGYNAIGLTSRFRVLGNGGRGRDASQETALRAALGLPAASGTRSGDAVTLVIPTDTARARHWSRLHALRHTRATGQPVVLAEAGAAPPANGPTIDLDGLVSPAAVGGVLPRCPGPFGGTTVLVLPDDLPEADVAAWLALEENDPLNKASRFHRLRIARSDASPDAGDRALPNLLQTLEREGRTNVLIVPAVFCADADTMRDLERSTRSAADRMTVHWLPGLGGQELPAGDALSDTGPGVLDHTLRVMLDPASSRVSVEDTILLPPALRHAGASFTLNSALEISGSVPALEKLGTETDGDGPETARYALKADAPDGVLRLSYAGVVDFGLGDEVEQYQKGFRETHGLLGPEGVYLDGGSVWIAQFADEMKRFEIEIEAPADWHVISQGDGASDAGTAPGGGRLARWDSRGALEQVYLVGGPLTVERETAGAVEVLVYLHERDEALSRKYLDATARYIEMYRSLIGPYPYGKFALVENFWETGYGMPSFTLLGEQVIRLPFILHSSYPHEILHNWWGNSVFVEYESGNWCEGLTAYMADHLIQEQRGAGSAYRRGTLQKYRSYVRDGRDFPLAEFRNRHSAATEAVGYGKSLMLFHMLRRRVGDDAFRAAIADFYRANRGERAGFEDLRASFESVTGEDLSGFFDAWVGRAGAPDLRVTGVTIDGPSGDGRYTVSGTLEQRQAGEAFPLSVPVVIATEGGQGTFIIESDRREVPFSLAVGARPTALAVDPWFDLFRLLDPREVPSSIGQIFGAPRVLAVLPASGDADAYRALVEGWRTDDHAIDFVTDDAIDALPSDRAVWVLGRENRFAAGLAAPDGSGSPGASHAPDGVMLGGERVGLGGNSVVVVRRNPGDPEQAIGWISVDPPSAFAGFARKLPHYGKYSYLAFEGGEPANFVRGQWEASDSPLVVQFDPGASAGLRPEARPALAELPPVFSRAKLRTHVEWLAAPEREGRGLGSEGLAASAGYIAERFADAGLEPGGDDGTWFQRFTVERGPDGSPVEAVNVVGVLPGTRDEWADQSVVVGAHYDHLGLGWPDVHAGDEGLVHHGADDNASGVSVLIELARVMASEGAGSRNLVFVAFSGEEAGLVGSRRYVADPPFPVPGMRGMINLDTVGRLGEGELTIHATGTADEWPHIFRGVGFVTGINSRSIGERVGGSDQESFIEAGVPAVQLFTGAHADYHRPTDTADKVDNAGLVKVATFVKEALVYLVEREEPMNVRIDGTTTDPGHAGGGHGSPAGESGRRVSFGTVPRFDFPGPGVEVESVVPGSPAETAGVRAGDVLIRIDGTPIADLRAFSAHLRTLKPGDEVVAVVRRDGAEVPLRVRVEAR